MKKRRDSKGDPESRNACQDLRLLLPVLVCLLFVSVPAAAQAPKKVKMDRSQPILIESDRLDAFQEKKLVIFSGQAIARQGDKTIRADRLLIYYKDQSTAPEGKARMDGEAVGDFEKLEAQGQVVITQTHRVVTGEHAVYHQDLQTIVTTGNAVLREGKNIVQGEKIIVYLDEDRGVIEGSERRRVTATIYPGEKNAEGVK